MKREFVSDDGDVLEKEEDEHFQVRVTRIRDEIVAQHRTIAQQNEELDMRFRKYVQLENELDMVCQAREMALEEREKNFELSTQRITSTVTPNKIKLDVGGRIFSVTLDMMLRYPDSFFARMFSGSYPGQIGSDGAYFINRSPKMFDYVVDYLRDGHVELELNSSDQRALHRDAEFYQLSELMQSLVPPSPEVVVSLPDVAENGSREEARNSDEGSVNNNRVRKRNALMDNWTWTATPNGKLSNDRRTLTGKQLNGDEFACSRGTSGWTQGVHEWVVRLNTDASCVFVGISLENINPKESNDDICYVLNCNDARAHGPFLKAKKCFSNVPKAGLPVGSQVSLRLDLDRKALTFGLNGKWNDKSAFIDVPPNTWYPYVLVWKNMSVTIVRGE
jgi:hypothetical protein